MAVNLSGVGVDYFIELMHVLPRADIDVYVPFPDSFYMLKLGATGMVSMEGNVIPRTFRRYLDCYEEKRLDDLAKIYSDISRFIQHVRRWQSSTPRWLKMAMRVLKLPGWEGGVREPYCMPPDSEVQKFTDGLFALGLPEIEEQAKAAGLAIPAR
jgi:dihydrodipicolinate synthase/N-acetylneuraminate lyase